MAIESSTFGWAFYLASDETMRNEVGVSPVSMEDSLFRDQLTKKAAMLAHEAYGALSEDDITEEKLPAILDPLYINHLSTEKKNTLYNFIWKLSSEETLGDTEWGKNHLFDNPEVFFASVKALAITEDKTDRLGTFVANLALTTPLFEGAEEAEHKLNNWFNMSERTPLTPETKKAIDLAYLNKFIVESN